MADNLNRILKKKASIHLLLATVSFEYLHNTINDSPEKFSNAN